MTTDRTVAQSQPGTQKIEVSIHNLPATTSNGGEGWPLQELESAIEHAWATEQASHSETVREAVEATLLGLDCGRVRVAERQGVGQWIVNQWVKKAVLLSFRLSDNKLLRAGDLTFFDKVAPKFANLDEHDMRASGVRIVPPAVTRRGSFLA